MGEAIRTGASFGLTSAVITTLGLMVGLNAGTHSSLAVIGGVLTIAIADALSDALGIHVSEESKTEDSQKEVWISTFSTFITKALIGMTFVVSLFLFPLQKAVSINVGWGFFLLIALSYYIGKHERTPAWKVVLEHALVALAVILVTQLLGSSISSKFGKI